MEIWETSAWPHFTHDPAATEAALTAFSERLGAISGLRESLTPGERHEAFLRAITHEAISSFAIEGANLPTAEIEASVIASLVHRGAEPQRRTDAIANLMLEAREPQQALTADRLFHWHRLLFYGVEVEDKGRWRTFPMVIAKSAAAGKDEILYRAPPAQSVPAMMDAFLDRLARDTRPLPIKAALAHLWFESIHPFSDGNGRLGRAIVEHIFAQEAALPFSLSRQIEADKRGYYVALQLGRNTQGDRIDATPFVLWFLDRLIAGVTEAMQDARFLVTRNTYFMRFPDLPTRAEAVFRRLFKEGSGRIAEGISAAPYARIAKVSSATATRDLATLEDMGAIVRGSKGGRSTRYYLAV